MRPRKRELFRELLAGIRAMRDHAEGRIDLRSIRVSPSGTDVDAASSGRLPRRQRRRLKRGSVA